MHKSKKGREIYCCVHVDMYLALSIDSNDSTGQIVNSGDKYCLSADAVHVDACPSLQVVEVDVAELCDEVDDVVLCANLEGEREEQEERKREQVRMKERERQKEREGQEGRGRKRMEKERPAWRQGSLSVPQAERKHRLPSSGRAGCLRPGYQLL